MTALDQKKEESCQRAYRVLTSLCRHGLPARCNIRLVTNERRQNLGCNHFSLFTGPPFGSMTTAFKTKNDVFLHICSDTMLPLLSARHHSRLCLYGGTPAFSGILMPF